MKKRKKNGGASLDSFFKQVVYMLEA